MTVRYSRAAQQGIMAADRLTAAVLLLAGALI